MVATYNTGTSWKKGMEEKSYLVHGSQEVEQGNRPKNEEARDWI